MGPNRSGMGQGGWVLRPMRCGDGANLRLSTITIDNALRTLLNQRVCTMPLDCLYSMSICREESDQRLSTR